MTLRRRGYLLEKVMLKWRGKGKRPGWLDSIEDDPRLDKASKKALRKIERGLSFSDRNKAPSKGFLDKLFAHFMFYYR